MPRHRYTTGPSKPKSCRTSRSLSPASKNVERFLRNVTRSAQYGDPTYNHYTAGNPGVFDSLRPSPGDLLTSDSVSDHESTTSFLQGVEDSEASEMGENHAKAMDKVEDHEKILAEETGSDNISPELSEHPDEPKDGESDGDDAEASPSLPAHGSGNQNAALKYHPRSGTSHFEAPVGTSARERTPGRKGKTRESERTVEGTFSTKRGHSGIMDSLKKDKGSKSLPPSSTGEHISDIAPSVEDDLPTARLGQSNALSSLTAANDELERPNQLLRNNHDDESITGKDGFRLLHTWPVFVQGQRYACTEDGQFVDQKAMLTLHFVDDKHPTPQTYTYPNADGVLWSDPADVTKCNDWVFQWLGRKGCNKKRRPVVTYIEEERQWIRDLARSAQMQGVEIKQKDVHRKFNEHWAGRLIETMDEYDRAVRSVRPERTEHSLNAEMTRHNLLKPSLTTNPARSTKNCGDEP